jgi:hypothetical protein
MEVVAAVVLAVIAALLPIVALYRLVARHDAKIERTATEEMWSRDLQFWKAHNETGHGVTAVTRRDRIADTAATTNNTRSMWE